MKAWNWKFLTAASSAGSVRSLYSFQCCFTSTETTGTVRNGETGTATSTSHSSWSLIDSTALAWSYYRKKRGCLEFGGVSRVTCDRLSHQSQLDGVESPLGGVESWDRLNCHWLVVSSHVEPSLAVTDWWCRVTWDRLSLTSQCRRHHKLLQPVQWHWTEHQQRQAQTTNCSSYPSPQTDPAYIAYLYINFRIHAQQATLKRWMLCFALGNVSFGSVKVQGQGPERTGRGTSPDNLFFFF